MSQTICLHILAFYRADDIQNKQSLLHWIYLLSLHCVFKIKFLKWTINFILLFQTLHVMWRKILAQLIKKRGNVSKTFYAYEHKLQSGDVKKDKEKLLFLIFKSKSFATKIINKHCIKRQDIKELWWNHWNWDSIDHYKKILNSSKKNIKLAKSVDNQCQLYWLGVFTEKK